MQRDLEPPRERQGRLRSLTRSCIEIIAGLGMRQPLSTAEGLPAVYLTDRRGGVRGYMLGEADWSSAEALALLDHIGRP